MRFFSLGGFFPKKNENLVKSYSISLFTGDVLTVCVLCLDVQLTENASFHLQATLSTGDLVFTRFEENVGGTFVANDAGREGGGVGHHLFDDRRSIENDKVFFQFLIADEVQGKFIQTVLDQERSIGLDQEGGENDVRRVSIVDGHLRNEIAGQECQTRLIGLLTFGKNQMQRRVAVFVEHFRRCSMITNEKNDDRRMTLGHGQMQRRLLATVADLHRGVTTTKQKTRDQQMTIQTG